MHEYLGYHEYIEFQCLMYIQYLKSGRELLVLPAYVYIELLSSLTRFLNGFAFILQTVNVFIF